MLGTHHTIIRLISPLPTILGNVPIILMVLQIILSDFPLKDCKNIFVCTQH